MSTSDEFTKEDAQQIIDELTTDRTTKKMNYLIEEYSMRIGEEIKARQTMAKMIAEGIINADTIDELMEAEETIEACRERRKQIRAEIRAISPPQ